MKRLRVYMYLKSGVEVDVLVLPARAAMHRFARFAVDVLVCAPMGYSICAPTQPHIEYTKPKQTHWTHSHESVT